VTWQFQGPQSKLSCWPVAHILLLLGWHQHLKVEGLSHYRITFVARQTRLWWLRPLVKCGCHLPFDAIAEDTILSEKAGRRGRPCWMGAHVRQLHWKELQLQGSPNIDVHSHVFPQGAAYAASRGQAWHGLALELEGGGSITLKSRAGGRYTWNPRYWEGADRRRQAMRELSVAVEVLSISGGLFGYALDPQQALLAAREFNDEIAEMCRNGSEFLGLGTLPLQDPRLALRELERVRTDLGLFGIVVGAHVNGELWDSPRLFPVLQAATEMGLFVLIHPEPWTLDRSLDAYHLTETLAHQSQMTYAAASLIFGGVLDRLTDLTVCLAQGGGFSAFAAGRLDHAYTLWREQQVISALPSSYLSRLYFDSLIYSSAALRSLAEVAGFDRILFGTDYPSSLCVADPVAWIGQCELESNEAAAILGGNFQRVLTASSR
jgi:aminocarboxymuconate-semialdehyde decarboxylase